MPGPLTCGGGFHLRYDSADSFTLANEQLLAVNLIASNGSPALLTGSYLVETLPQPDLLFAAEHFVASG